MPTQTKKKTSAPEITVAMAKFDSTGAGTRFAFMRECAINDWTLLGPKDYAPAGGTPLRDATMLFLRRLDELVEPGKVVIGLLADESGSMGGNQGAVIDGLNEFVGGLVDIDADEATDGKVLAVIFTDGGENSSREVTAEQLQAAVAEREARGWTFIYMGANQDAWGEGASMGLAGATTSQRVNFAATQRGTTSAMASVRSHAVGYLSDNDSYHVAASAAPSRTIAEDGSGDVDLTGVPQPGGVWRQPTTYGSTAKESLEKALDTLKGEEK